MLSQDKAKVLADVRAIISEQLGTELEKVSDNPGNCSGQERIATPFAFAWSALCCHAIVCGSIAAMDARIARCSALPAAALQHCLAASCCSIVAF